MSTQTLVKLYQKLFSYFGPQYWWPAKSPFEVMVGAILTQNTSWQNVEKAIVNLKKNKLLSARKMRKLPLKKLAFFIRPAGYYNIKAKRLKNFLQFFFEEYKEDVSRMKKTPLSSLRKKLLALNGIGRETADSILLYALGKPIFVVDAYTKRILSRHGLASADADYQDIQRMFMMQLPKSVKLFNEFHALLVRLGKEFCLKNNPRCNDCPIQEIRKF